MSRPQGQAGRAVGSAALVICTLAALIGCGKGSTRAPAPSTLSSNASARGQSVALFQRTSPAANSNSRARVPGISWRRSVRGLIGTSAMSVSAMYNVHPGKPESVTVWAWSTTPNRATITVTQNVLRSEGMVFVATGEVPHRNFLISSDLASARVNGKVVVRSCISANGSITRQRPCPLNKVVTVTGTWRANAPKIYFEDQVTDNPLDGTRKYTGRLGISTVCISLPVGCRRNGYSSIDSNLWTR